MSISEEQLEAWSSRGAIVTSENTHNSILDGLTKHPRIGNMIKSGMVEVFKQGSYENETNVRGDSDVDTVVMLKQTVYYKLDLPDPQESARCLEALPAPTYSWDEFYSDVTEAMYEKYGKLRVEEGDKALHVRGEEDTWRMPADVVPSLEYRYYNSTPFHFDQEHVSGIYFQTRRTREDVVNFPRIHSRNGRAKDARTGGRFKSCVRMFKNARNRMIEEGMIPSELAPSYFIECLLYNVPDMLFFGTRQEMFMNALRWLEQNIESRLITFMCQNQIIPLFNDSDISSGQQWRRKSASELVVAYRKLWDEK